MAKKTEGDIIEKAIKRLKAAVKSDEHNRSAGIDDLKFANGEQWSSAEKKRRSDDGRPALTVNLLPKYVEQVVGDMLHNTPSVKIRPVDSRGDMNIAKIRQGIISQIEYQSNSKGIYGYGSRQMVTCGYGAWRVLTRYCEDNPFLQEIYLQGIRNPFLVYMDPTAQDQNYADAKWGLLLEKMSKEDFEDKYPNAALPTDDFKTGPGLADEHWYDGEKVTVAEYFEKSTETVKMVQLDDGRVMSEEEYKEIHKKWKEKFQELLDKIEMGPEAQPAMPPMGGATPAPPQQPIAQGAPPPPQVPASMGAGPVPSPQVPPAGPGQMPPQGPQGAKPPMPPMGAPQAPAMQNIEPEPKIAKRRDTEKTVIRHRILTCLEILEGGVEGDIFPGKYIPLVLLKGKELNIEGKNYVYSLIRHAKDPQKLINYWNTSAAEVIALAPKAPWIGTAKQFEGYEEDYASANVKNFPMLKYNADPEAAGAPIRQSPGQPPVAIFEQIRRGEENLKSVIGMFNADVGAQGSEQTGAAITARQKPGDIGTFEFMENLARSVSYTGKIINSMIPEVYDTERDVRIRNIDESESFVPVNTTVGAAVKSVEKDPERFLGLDHTKLRDIFSKDGKDAKFNDITVGDYDVVVTTGPSYATQRQESAQHLMQLIQSNPQQMSLAMDLVVENMDFKDADVLAARLRKTLPPNMAKPRQGEQPTPPPPPPPQVLLAQAKVESEKIKAETMKAKLQLEQMKMQKEMKGEQQAPPDPSVAVDAQLSQMKVQLEQMKMQHEKEKIAAENQRQQLQAQLEQSRLQFEVQRQNLTLQLQRESHIAKMREMEMSAEEKRAMKREPKRRVEE